MNALASIAPQLVARAVALGWIIPPPLPQPKIALTKMEIQARNRAHYLAFRARNYAAGLGARGQVLKGGSGAPTIYNFSGVDWSLSDRQIAAQLGCDRSLVTKRRNGQ